MLLGLENILSDFSACFASTFISRPRFFLFLPNLGLYALPVSAQRLVSRTDLRQTIFLKRDEPEDRNIIPALTTKSESL